MGKIVFMFPGQGAQYVGMGKDFYDSFACSKEIFDKANEVLDIDVKKLCFEENEDINITEYTQAAMVTASVAILKKIEEMGLKPDLTAGLSLGEYCALVASDVMSFEDAVKVVRQRGILMQDTVPAGEGAMSAVLGMKKEAIELQAALLQLQRGQNARHPAADHGHVRLRFAVKRRARRSPARFLPDRLHTLAPPVRFRYVVCAPPHDP